jgi:hypothetical protein
MKPTLPASYQLLSSRDQTQVLRTLDVRKETLVLGVVVDEALKGTANLEKTVSCNSQHRVALTAYHGVLAHQDNTLTTEGDTDLVHLLRADIVDTNDEHGLVFIEEKLQLLEVSGLGCFIAPHVSLFQ